MKLPVNYNEICFPERKKVREEYVKLQEGLCCYCNKHLGGPPADHVRKKFITKSLFPENFFKYPVHLHHDHCTGMTIGAIHNYCNAVSWEYDGI